MDWKTYLLSRCSCTTPIRVRRYGRKPNECEQCGGWLPALEWYEEPTSRPHIGSLQWLGWLAMACALIAILSRC